jgi:hypothetical protein
VNNDAEALRASLDARLLQAARRQGSEVNRLRRHLVFARLLRGLAADGGWVLKGGYLLETRLGLAARATRDLDLATTFGSETEELERRFRHATEGDTDRDGFVFKVMAARAHLLETGGPGLHLSVSADLADRQFAAIRVDAVCRPEELAGSFDLLTLPLPVDVAAWQPVVIPAIDVAQHVAEKLHALANLAAHPPGSRTCSTSR